MEPWHEFAFLAADGQHTVGQFVENMASQFEGGQPASLTEQIQQSISDL